jgi:adenylosuccinate lyase
VQAGLQRDEAYRIVQAAAMQAWDEGRDFRSLVEADPAVSALGAAVLDDAFSLDRVLEHAHRAVDALDDIAI